MSAQNCTRNGCRDVFHAFLVKNARYDGQLEIPCIDPETRAPEQLVSFSKSLHSTDYGAWVHFYEDDSAFERIWNKPVAYLPILKRFAGVISPDFSLYRDMPLVMQQWNTYRGRAIGHWLQENGLVVIPNIRFAMNVPILFAAQESSVTVPLLSALMAASNLKQNGNTSGGESSL